MKKCLIALFMFVTVWGCTSEATQEIQWIYGLSKSLKLAQEENKPLMVDFYADWCIWCKRLDRRTYRHSGVIELSSNFVCVKIDTDKNPRYVRRYSIRGLPTIIFLKPNGEIIERVLGYRDGKTLTEIMSKVIKKNDKTQ
ncbi:TPA: hypothetical protein DCX15_02375 [bacterium]|nr:hypothetical protein [bacterium]